MVALLLAHVCHLPATRVVIDRDAGVARVRVPGGAYAGTVAWPSRAMFLSALDIAVRGVWRTRLRRTIKDAVSPDSFMRWARREAAGADSSTGRGQQESVDTVAADLQCSTALVQRCRRIARDLGIYRDVVAGRLLRLTERLEVHARGSKQRGVTGERAFTVPPELRPILASLSPRPSTRHVGSATQPGRGPVQRERLGKTAGLGRRERRKAADSVGPRANKNGSRSRERFFGDDGSTNSRRPSRLAAGERLARDVCARLPYRHRLQPRRVAAHFAEFERQGWSPSAVLDAADAVLRTLGWTSPASAGSGYLVWVLRHIDPTAYDSPPDRPDWCGSCDQVTRLVEIGDSDRVGRCPVCHPLTAGQDA